MAHEEIRKNHFKRLNDYRNSAEYAECGINLVHDERAGRTRKPNACAK